ncbi:MAG: transglycosylase domain-containing protein [Deltaproteobacteria bacterium]|nr:transglycosylase domain-containing protein [Deltaproteobacteria bacterium]
MGLRAKIIAVLILVPLVAAGALGPSFVRSRVRQGIVSACARRLGARCQVGSVDLAMDGALLRRVVVDLPGARRHLSVSRVGVRFRWPALVLGRTQRLDVQAEGIELRAQGPIEEIIRRPVAAPSAEGGRRRFVLGSVHLDRIQADLELREGEHSRARLQLREAVVDVTDTRDMTVRWSELRAEAPHVVMRSGTCVALRRAAEQSLNCTGFEALADVRAKDALPPFLDEVEAAWRREHVEAVDTPATGPGAAGPGPARALSVQAREGSIRLQRGGEDLVRLDPASLTLQAHGRVIDELRVEVGADQGGAITASYARDENARWQVEVEAGTLPLQRLAPWLPFIPWHAPERGTARFHLRVEPPEGRTEATVLEVSGNVTVDHFGLRHPGLAREPLDALSASLSGRATLDLERRRVTSPGISAELNGLRFFLSGSAERGRDHSAVDAVLRVPVFDCDLPRRVLPPAAVGPLAGFLFSGTLAGDLHIALDTRRLGDTVLDVNVQDGCDVSQSSVEVGLRRLGNPFIQRVQEPNNVVRTFLTGPGTPAWTAFEAISPFVVGAVIQREDGGFYRHHGFSPDEVRGALIRNVNAGRFAFGASTITMQLVKNVFLAREKTLVRKLQEVALTWWLERSLDKRSILELYLNVVEFGPGIYGIGPAARFFFGREPNDLTVLQGIYLATLLPAPIPRYGMFERGAIGSGTLQQLRHIARSMAANRLITPAEAAAADHEGIAFRPRNSPVPGPQTVTVDPLTTDEQALEMAQRLGVQVHPALPDDPNAPAPAPAEPSDEPGR